MADGAAQNDCEEDDEDYIPQNDADFEKLTTEDALDGDVYLLNGSKTTGRQSGAKRKSDQSVASSVLEQIKERKHDNNEISENKIEEKILKNQDIFNRGHSLKKIDIDNTYPEYILKNKTKLSKWIL